ncbi:hypothetical protein B0J12DRAFT_641327 [Macrophomina phaseolina]|uniref:Uncharacterized protein n=1 Tax=Macrophomina phaseolina TaxID=35725 RepID=A0ABQ8GRF2_9PEZI|nr:hypothetical protein B0J12DRAFT_641327 [Macrophomina phaseolina]
MSKLVELPNGKTISTLRTISLPFTSRNEVTPHNLVFHVMENCAHDCILGKQFLKDTQTLGKNFSKRVGETIVGAHALLRCDFVDAPE